nr:immunoglobulin heavy chain junction region [Mus musculus]MBK4196732.1 immunoglobulin heavy chain junction region [Mus musculus]
CARDGPPYWYFDVW